MNVNVSNFVNWEYTTRSVCDWFGLPCFLEKLFRMIREDMNCMFSSYLHDLCMHAGWISLTNLVTNVFDCVTHDSLLISRKPLVVFLSKAISAHNIVDTKEQELELTLVT